LTYLSIPTKLNQSLSYQIFVNSLNVVKPTLSNFGNAQVDKETKTFNLMPLYPCKNSWEFSKKSESDDILNVWKMTFQASNLKGKQFLDLLDDKNNIIEPSYSKGGSWLKAIGHLNSLCAQPQELSQTMLLLANIDLDSS